MGPNTKDTSTNVAPKALQLSTHPFICTPGTPELVWVPPHLPFVSKSLILKIPPDIPSCFPSAAVWHRTPFPRTYICSYADRQRVVMGIVMHLPSGHCLVKVSPTKTFRSTQSYSKEGKKSDLITYSCSGATAVLIKNI